MDVGYMDDHVDGGVGFFGGSHNGEGEGVVAGGGSVCLVVGKGDEMEYAGGRVEVELASVGPELGVNQGCVRIGIGCGYDEERRSVVLGRSEVGVRHREGGTWNERRPVVRPIGILGKGRVDQAFVDVGEDRRPVEHVCHVGHGGGVPVAYFLVELGGTIVHVAQVCDSGDVPVAGALIELRGSSEHVS